MQIYYMGANYRRALCLLKASGLIETDANYRYLAAKCLAEVKEWEECLCLLEEAGEEKSQVRSLFLRSQRTDLLMGRLLG